MSLRADTSLTSREPPGPRRVFALTGGGNLGAAQVGQLLALFDAGIAPDALVGVSVGALNAAYVAGGYSRERLESLGHEWRRFGASDVFGSGRLTPAVALVRRRTSLFDGDALRRTIGRLCPFTDLAQASIPLWVGTCPLDAHHTRWWNSGPAVDILCASAALPGVLPPVLLDGSLHVDGGVLDNVPVSFALRQRPDELYILDVSGKDTGSSPTTSLGVLLAAFGVARRAHMIGELADLGIDVPLWWLPSGIERGRELRIHDFSQSEALIEDAYTLTASFLAQRHLGSGNDPAVDGL